MDYLGATLELKAVQAAERIISGYAAGIGNQDRVQDVILPGAFTKTLASRPPADVAVFIGHKTDSLPVGIPLVIRETPQGLYTETRIKPGPVGDDLLATAEFLQRHGRALGMSIGYRVPPGGAKLVRDAEGKTLRHLSAIDLHEYSFAASQSIANAAALVTGVKAMTYHIEARGAEFVLLNSDGEEEGRFPTRAAAMTEMRRLMAQGDEGDTPGPMGKVADADEDEHKAVWTQEYINSLPDSSFLYVEPGDKEDGKTVPLSKRHFPYKDASGSIDLPHLRNAIARIPQSNAPGLNKTAVQGRAQRLLQSAQGGGKLADSAAPEWQHGAAPALYGAAARLMLIGEAVAAEQKAMAFLGQDVHAGALIRPEHCADLAEVLADVQALVGTAQVLNDGTANRGQVARYRSVLRLWDLAS